MENKIHLLPDDLINKIAAGEVVERPASIVKELLENSVDSGATNIELSLDKGGLESITVSDNGVGMNKLEVQKAFIQHTTSKINSISDLFNISTLGFRGEALASISSISNVTVHTYNGTDQPVEFSIQDKESTTLIGQGRNIGTTIIVKNIFKNIPVRRKFLKSESTEYKYIYDTFVEIALSKPEIGFSLIKNGKSIYKLQPSSSLIERVLSLYKTLSKDSLIPLIYDSSSIKISGLLGHPELAKTINTYQYIFINSRYVRNPLINKAIKEGFATSIMKDLEPVYFLFFNLKNEEIDVNVHPRKLEVRFNNPGQIYSTTKNAVTKTLELFSQKAFRADFKQNEQSQNLQAIKNESIFTKWNPLEVNFKFPREKNTISAGIDFTKGIIEQTSDIGQDKLINENRTEIYKTLQIFDTYIIFEMEEKLLIIDQHAAHERINFEKYIKIIESEKNLTSQNILIPIDFKISQSTKESIFKNEKFIKQLGFDFNIIENSLLINQIPNLIPLTQVENVFKELLSELETTEGQGSNKWNNTRNKLISTIACHSSIRAGQKLDSFTITNLVSDLNKCKLPYSCPHGRPFYWEITRDEIEKKFKRVL